MVARFRYNLEMDEVDTNRGASDAAAAARPNSETANCLHNLLGMSVHPNDVPGDGCTTLGVSNSSNQVDAITHINLLNS